MTTEILPFKQIIWDQGWIWILMLVMGIAWIFDTLRQIMRDAKGPSEAKASKPSYEIIVRKKIE